MKAIKICAGYRDVDVEDDFDIYSDNVFELTGE